MMDVNLRRPFRLKTTPQRRTSVLLDRIVIQKIRSSANTQQVSVKYSTRPTSIMSVDVWFQTGADVNYTRSDFYWSVCYTHALRLRQLKFKLDSRQLKANIWIKQKSGSKQINKRIKRHTDRKYSAQTQTAWTNCIKCVAKISVNQIMQC